MQSEKYSAAAQRISLQQLLHMSEKEIAAADRQTANRLLAAAEGKLLRERNKGAMRHWSYDLNRHLKLRTVRDSLRRKLEVNAARRERPAHQL